MTHSFNAYQVVRREYNMATATVDWFPLGGHGTFDRALLHAECLVGMIGLRIVNTAGDSFIPMSTAPNTRPWIWRWQDGCRF